MPRLREPGELTWRLRTLLMLTFAILFTPLAVVVAMSFNASPYGTLPIVLTTKWYEQLFAGSDLFTATWISMQLSIEVAVASAVLGTLLAVWLVRRAKRAAVLITGMLISAITIPWLILGVAMLIVMNAVGLGRSITAMFLGSLATSLPYAVLIVAARLREIEPEYEDAARSLGASPPTVLTRIVVPMAFPAILGGGLMAFMVCFNNFVIQYFLAPFGVRTLPLEIYTLVRVGYRPDINALATVLIGVTVVLVFVLHRLGAGASRLTTER